MKVILSIFMLSSATAYVLGHFGVWDSFQQKAATVYKYEGKIHELSHENRLLAKEISDLKADVSKLKTDKNYLTVKLAKKGAKRSIASIAPAANDLVQYEVYQWTADTMLNIGQKEFQYKKFEKSAQFLNSYIAHYPNHEKINDRILFEAGIAAFESKKHYKWAIEHFEKLVTKYPKSKYYRGAKLWKGLSHLNTGNKKEFLATVEEFRKKYRNTNEWKVLSEHYENLVYKYNNEK